MKQGTRSGLIWIGISAGIVATCAMFGCGGEIVWHPPEPTPTASPAPSGSPSATPEPVPTLFPTPEPAPTATPTPEPIGCEPPLASCGEPACVFNPDQGEASFWPEVDAAQREANETFVGSDGKIPLPRESEYTRTIASLLRDAGVCAVSGADVVGGPIDEVWVTARLPVAVCNSRSEHYDVFTSDGTPWDKLAAVCSPSHF